MILQCVKYEDALRLRSMEMKADTNREFCWPEKNEQNQEVFRAKVRTPNYHHEPVRVEGPCYYLGNADACPQWCSRSCFSGKGCKTVGAAAPIPLPLGNHGCQI